MYTRHIIYISILVFDSYFSVNVIYSRRVYLAYKFKVIWATIISKDADHILRASDLSHLILGICWYLFFPSARCTLHVY